MPTYIKCLTRRGLIDVDYTANDLKTAAEYEPDDGVYAITNTHNITQTLMLDAHLDRFEDSAQRENIALQYDRAQFKVILRQMIVDADYGSVRFRVTVSRATPDELLISLEPYTPPSQALLEQGVRCMTSRVDARRNPSAKTTDWMHERKTIQETMPNHIYDTFLVNPQGYVLEGLGSNFYTIFNGELRTTTEGVLPGISQRIVFEIHKDIIPLRKDSVHVDDIPNFSEAFLTSSTRGIIPVVEIDGIAIGDGKVGEKTKLLRQAYQAWMDEHLEEL